MNGGTTHGSDHRIGATATLTRRRGAGHRGAVPSRRGAARDDRCGGELSSDVGRRAEHVGNRVDAEQNADSLDRQSDAREHGRHRDDRPAGNSRYAETRNDGRQHDRRRAASH